MTIQEIQNLFKNMSDQEIASLQNAVITSPQLNNESRMFCLALIGEELGLRQNEGLGRKASRFWNRHGQSTAVKAALIGIGALIGIQLS